MLWTRVMEGCFSVAPALHVRSNVNQHGTFSSIEPLRMAPPRICVARLPLSPERAYLFGKPAFLSIGGSHRLPRFIVEAKRNSVDAGERIIAAAGYLLPLLDGMHYGRFFFFQFPAAEAVVRPLFPLLQFYKGVPFASFVTFFALYLLVVRNPSFSRYVRFNTMQAVVLDVLLILPGIIERTFSPRGGIGFDLLVIFYNTVFLYLVACFVFGTVSCLLGRVPRLPLVADAADAQVM